MPILKAPRLVATHSNRCGSAHIDDSGGHRIDRCARDRDNVDAVVEGERPRQSFEERRQGEGIGDCALALTLSFSGLPVSLGESVERFRRALRCRGRFLGLVYGRLCGFLGAALGLLLGEAVFDKPRLPQRC